MKRCLTCNSTFDEEHLSYCTNDGSLLIEGDIPPGLEIQPTAILDEPPPTVRMPPPRPTDYMPRTSGNTPPIPQPYGWAGDSPAPWVPPAPAPASYPFPAAKQQQTLAAISLILGFIGITFGWLCGGPIFGLAAVILGAVALSQIKRDPVHYGGKPLALIGLITGIVILLINIAIIAFWIAMMAVGSR